MKKASLESKEAKTKELAELASSHGTKVLYMQAGDTVRSKRAAMRCLYPKDSDKAEDVNDLCLVLQFEEGDIRALFGGDISTDVEEQLSRREKWDKVLIFKADHHGSRYANAEALLKCIRPEITVASAGKDNRYGHPSPDAVQRIKEYNVLYLMHGIGGDEAEWGMVDEDSLVKRMMDNLIYYKEIEPFIVVTPNGRSTENCAREGSDYNSFYVFGKELRSDLIPYMEAHYSTYAVEGDPSASRMHRAMAGLSMGGMQTINIGIGECMDLFSYFGAFSAAPTSNSAEKTAKILEDTPYTVDYFYNICGTEDEIAYDSAAAAAKNLPDLCDKLTEPDNFIWQELKGMHDFHIWYLGFFNFAQIAFK